jgi:TonB family protein
MVQLAGQSMLGGKRPAIDVEQVKWIAADLLNRVEQLQPGSQAMVEAREGVRLLGVDFKPQAETSTPAVLRVGGNVQAMNLLTSTPPVYPAEAQARGIQGVVKLQIRIDNTGYVDSVTLVSGDPALTDAAITAVRQYVYKPTMLNGQAYAVVTTVDVPFVLN